MEMGLISSKGENVDIPLKEVCITGKLCNIFEEVSIKQVYENSGSINIEAVYTFPIPDKAAVTDFKASIGSRNLAGVIMEKDKAYKVYDDSVRKGDSAYLLEQYRPNVFQVSLGNVLPGEAVSIEISYVNELKIEDNEIRINIPTVVAPRYIPGKISGNRKGMGAAHPTDRVPDADFITPPVGDTDYWTSINYEINAVNSISSVQSPSHNIKVEKIEPTRTKISLALADNSTTMDRDFVLVCSLKEDSEAGGMACENEVGGIVHLSFTPDIPMVMDEKPLDYIFLIDVSGSMGGIKLEQAKSALNICIRNLTDRDTFNIVAFESSCHYFSASGSLKFNQENLDKATKWINNLESMGGTEILDAVRYSLQSGINEKVILLFTDGEVGNEAEILKYVTKAIGNNRIYTFGIDTAVNGYFITGLAQAGRGRPEFIYPGERIDDKVIRQFSRINTGCVREVKVNWIGLKVYDVLPVRLDALYSMEPVSIIAGYHGELAGSIEITGTMKDEKYSCSMDLDIIRRDNSFKVLEKIYARKKMEYLEETMESTNPRRKDFLRKDIINLSLRYGIMSSHTSLVAVDERDVKANNLPETVVVPVSLPHSWSAQPRLLSSVASIDSMFMPDIDFSVDGSFVSEEFCLMEDEKPLFPKKAMKNPRLVNHSKQKQGTGGVSAKDILRILARNQNADGVFADKDEEDDLMQLESTCLAVIVFALNSEGSILYKRQIEKSVAYIAGFMDKSWDALSMEDKKEFYLKVMFALAFYRERGIVSSKLISKVEDILSLLKDNINSSGIRSVKASKALEAMDRGLEADRKALCSILDIKENERRLISVYENTEDEADCISTLVKLGIMIES